LKAASSSTFGVSATSSPAARDARRAAPVARREQLLGAILDGAPDPVVAIGCDDGRIRYANPACEEHFGAASAGVIGRHFSELMQSHRLDDDDAPGGVRRGHAEVRLPSGETRWIAYSASRVELPDAQGEVAVAFLRDETERRGDELRLSRHNDELEQTIRALAHDLRSPLVSVLGFSRLLREEFGAALGERGVHFLERIGAAGRSMESLIRDLLDFARIGHDGEAREVVDPREVLLQLKSELKPRLEQQEVALHLPESPPQIRCERTRLYQLFSNLIGNALDHMGPCESPRIAVDVLEAGGHHELVVSDNGRGVPPEQQERIFEMFHAVQHPGGRKGTGIGLAIVRKIAEHHGGRAWVECAPGRGAAFHVSLPRD
jgi:PAS domain S-box-containing protein